VPGGLKGPATWARDGPRRGKARGWAESCRGMHPKSAGGTCRGKNTCTGASSVRKSRFWEGGEACVDEKGNVVSSNTT
jgi:hypothetical protein